MRVTRQGIISVGIAFIIIGGMALLHVYNKPQYKHPRISVYHK